MIHKVLKYMEHPPETSPALIPHGGDFRNPVMYFQIQNFIFLAKNVSTGLIFMWPPILQNSPHKIRGLLLNIHNGSKTLGDPVETSSGNSMHHLFSFKEESSLTKLLLGDFFWGRHEEMTLLPRQSTKDRLQKMICYWRNWGSLFWLLSLVNKKNLEMHPEENLEISLLAFVRKKVTRKKAVNLSSSRRRAAETRKLGSQAV